MYKIIIADDEPKVSQLIKNLIDWENLGLEHVATAQDGITALELIKKHRPDIVVTDIRMPGYDGIELIKYAKEANPGTDFIIISGYQHFDYAHKAIKYGVKDYLLKPLKKNELNAALSKMIEKYREADSEMLRQRTDRAEGIKRLKNRLLEELYEGQGALAFKEADLNKINAEYDTGFIEGCYQALVIKPDFYYQPNNHELMTMLLNKISKVISGNLRSVCSEALSLILEDRIYMIVNYRAEDKKLLRKALNNIIDESHMFRDIFKNLTVTVGLGNVQSNISGTVQSTWEAREALTDRIVSGSGRIVQYSPELHIARPVETVVTFEKRRKLIALTEVFDIPEIKKWIDEIEAATARLSGISGQFVLDVVNEIVEIILYSLKNHANIGTAGQDRLEELQEILRMQNSIRSVFDAAGQCTVRLLQQIAEERKNESIRPIKEAQKYINEHYASAVSLEEVSSIVGFNATYFSTLFKKETGMNFLEYVTAARIKAAKQQLSDSRKSILDISHEVGYNDFKHFAKQFKKITGLSPSEYRKLYY